LHSEPDPPALTYLRHYTIRLRHSERLRYQFARALLAGRRNHYSVTVIDYRNAMKIHEARNAKCMEDAKAVFLASDFKCESFIDQDKESCLQLSQVWRKTPAAAQIMRENDENESAAGQSGAAPEDNSDGAPGPSSDPSRQRPEQ